MLFCGLDIGTTNIKAILLDDQGKLLAKTSIDARQACSSDWYSLCQSALDQLIQQIGSKTETIYSSAATQGGSFVILDQSLKPISKQSLWIDKADQHIADKLVSDFGYANFYKLSGWTPDLWLAICKLKQMKIRPSHYVAFVPDYICSQLTGQLTTDITNAQITGLLDFQKGSWHSPLLNWANISQQNLAPVIDKIEIVHENIKTRWGKLNWITSSHDQYAAMNALQIRPNQDVMLATGTAWVLNQKTSTPAFDKHFHNHPGRDFQPDTFGNIQTLGPIGRGYDILLEQLKLTHTHLSTPEAQAALQNIAPPKDSIQLTCEPQATASEPLQQLKRYMEWAAASVRFQLESNSTITNNQQSRIAMTGGAVANNTWPQIIADICQINVQALTFDELTAYGAAAYSAQAMGINFHDTLNKLASLQIFQPTNTKLYNDWYQNHQKPFLKNIQQQ